jgi:hypothetical protein
MSTTSWPNTTGLYTIIAANVEVIGPAYASIKVKTPDTFYRDQSKL